MSERVISIRQNPVLSLKAPNSNQVSRYFIFYQIESQVIKFVTGVRLKSKSCEPKPLVGKPWARDRQCLPWSHQTTQCYVIGDYFIFLFLPSLLILKEWMSLFEDSQQRPRSLFLFEWLMGPHFKHWRRDRETIRHNYILKALPSSNYTFQAEVVCWSGFCGKI